MARKYPSYSRKGLDHLLRVAAAFDRETLIRICEMPERDFAAEFGMDTVEIEASRSMRVLAGEDFYHFRSSGSNILAVAHLDTVSDPSGRTAQVIDTEGGPVVFSRALDDRLGAYVILDLLPKLGLNFDVLLTVGEESGCSTARFFEPAKEYDWMIEFDRGGTDVVMYQYETREMRDLLDDAGADCFESGSYTDICDLEHLGVKGFNWGVGYQQYHSERSHAFLADTFAMVSRFLTFHEANGETRFEHDYEPLGSRSSIGAWWYDDDLVAEGEICDALNIDPMDDLDGLYDGDPPQWDNWTEGQRAAYIEWWLEWGNTKGRQRAELTSAAQGSLTDSLVDDVG